MLGEVRLGFGLVSLVKLVWVRLG